LIYGADLIVFIVLLQKKTKEKTKRKILNHGLQQASSSLLFLRGMRGPPLFASAVLAVCKRK
jgi:hypothetical protein